MKVNKDVVDALIEGLENALWGLKNDMEYYIESMKEADTVEDIMHLKNQLLEDWLRNMPLGVAVCYFCILYDVDCESCIYAKHHGVCAGCPESSRTELYIELVRLIDKYSDSVDDWSIINTFKDALITAIQKKYYKGESYES